MYCGRSILNPDPTNALRVDQTQHTSHSHNFRFIHYIKFQYRSILYEFSLYFTLYTFFDLCIHLVEFIHSLTHYEFVLMEFIQFHSIHMQYAFDTKNSWRKYIFEYFFSFFFFECLLFFQRSWMKFKLNYLNNKKEYSHLNKIDKHVRVKAHAYQIKTKIRH